ncbi:syntaxin-17 [Brachionus plicatilis]|uniref:Syntaxin-17 n=1 Tax=Brachionus plicatilis TaxID=10195 RepID=A0A3M7Q0L7_BRAPC|nr:syntaxin-17 [Brachionus plicatilis]
MDDQIYEININRFIQSTEYQLNKLKDCISRLKEYQSYQDWKNVKQSHLNASQIIKRIKSEIKEIEKIRDQIVSNLENKNSSPIVNKIDDQLKFITRKLQNEANEIESLAAPYHQFEYKYQDSFLESNFVAPEMFQYKIEKNEFLAQDEELCNSYQQLLKDCDDLKFLMEKFSEELYKQKPTIDSIEKNLDTTEDNLATGSTNLRTALKYKVLGTASGGAVVGSLIGGPVGLLAGAKLGALVGLGGGLFGYTLSKYFNKPNY